MRCFLACFGFSEISKSRKLANKVQCTDQIHRSYESLDSFNLEINSSDSESKFSSSDAKEISTTLDTNFKSYEPLHNVDNISDFSLSKDMETRNSSCNYRYQNWRESDADEDNDMAFDESDLDDYVSDGDEEEMSEEVHENKNDNYMPLVASSDKKRDRSEYVISVLNPVENITQWRAIKAKIPFSEQQRKENTSLGSIKLVS